VHLKFKLRQETLYLCFQIIDRFLEKQLVARSRLQLVGVTGLMLASKYEEIYPPEVGTPELADMHQKIRTICTRKSGLLCKVFAELNWPRHGVSLGKRNQTRVNMRGSINGLL
jgi:hypothetical protein